MILEITVKILRTGVIWDWKKSGKVPSSSPGIGLNNKSHLSVLEAIAIPLWVHHPPSVIFLLCESFLATRHRRGRQMPATFVHNK
jgi:hypothetical protein